jgi:hypothetical protein
MDAPASWLQVQPGWKVYAADGTEVGEVDEVAGDESEDIFDGLAVAATALGKPRYVLAEQVVRITEGAVHLSLSTEQFESLGEYREPATSEEIEPDHRGGLAEQLSGELRELEGKVLRPTQRHAQSMNIWRRIYLFFRRQKPSR